MCLPFGHDFFYNLCLFATVFLSNDAFAYYYYVRIQFDIPGLLLNSKFDLLEMSNRIAVLRGNETVDIANWLKTIKV